MKKRSVLCLVMAVSLTMLSACSGEQAASEPAQVEQPAEVEETSTVEDAAKEEAAVEENAADETQAADSEENATDEEEILESADEMAKADAVLTEEDAKEYKEYLLSNMTEYGFTFKSDGNICGGQFCLYDCNGDGRKDLVITGPLGLRCAMLSEVYMPNNDIYEAIGLYGTPEGFFENGIVFDCEDYTEAGAVSYDSKAVYSFDLDAHDICEAEYNIETRYFDAETGEELENPEVLSETYQIMAEDCSKEECEAAFAEFSAKSKMIEMYELNSENVEKYIVADK